MMLKFIDSLSATKRTLIIAAVLLLGVGSLGLSVGRIHANGVPVVLATVPVDPRSLFQGDYVTLAYDINTIDSMHFEDQRSNEPGGDVYVELYPGNPVWTIVRASYIAITPSPGNVVIKGRQEGRALGRVRYGIETFLVPEGEGLAIERLRNASERVTVRVLVAPDGTALPQNILIDGRPVFRDAGL